MILDKEGNYSVDSLWIEKCVHEKRLVMLSNNSIVSSTTTVNIPDSNVILKATLYLGIEAIKVVWSIRFYYIVFYCMTFLDKILIENSRTQQRKRSHFRPDSIRVIRHRERGRRSWSSYMWNVYRIIEWFPSESWHLAINQLSDC